MSAPQFYLVAMYAKKMNPEDLIYTHQPDGSIKWEFKEGLELGAYRQTHFVLWAQGIVAPTQEVAKQTGMERLLAECPWEDGWIDHYVSLNTVSRAMLERICQGAAGQLETGNADEEWPDIIIVE